MPMGSQRQGGSTLGVNGATNFALNTQTAGTSAQVNSSAGNLQASFSGATWVLLGLALVWFAWSMVMHHTNMREKLSPANVASNIHNWFAIGIMAATFIVVMQILWTKLTSVGVPGAASIAKFFAAA